MIAASLSSPPYCGELPPDAPRLRKRPVGRRAPAPGSRLNGIVGVGIFFVPASVAMSAPGLGAVAVFALTGAALLPAALTFATLGRRFDVDGGPVVFARAAFGERVSFLVGWVAYVSALFSAARGGRGPHPRHAPGPGYRRGPRRSRRSRPPRDAPRRGGGLRPAPLRPNLDGPDRAQAAAARAPGRRVRPRLGALPGPSRRYARSGLASWRARGRLHMSGVRDRSGDRGQVRVSSRAVPFATVGSLLLAVALYLALVFACVTALPALASSSAPLADAAGVLGGAGLARLVAAGTGRFRPRSRLRDDGDVAAVPLRSRLGRARSCSPSTGCPRAACRCGRWGSPGWSWPRS